MSKHQVTFTPTVCEPRTVKEEGKPDYVVDSEYEGTVTLRMPSYDERLELLGDSAAAADASDQKAKRALDNMRRLAKRAPEFLVALNVKRKADGFLFTWDDLQYDSDMQALINEIANRLLGKYSVPGNATAPS